MSFVDREDVMGLIEELVIGIDGNGGTAEIELRSVPLWVALIPGMETLL